MKESALERIVSHPERDLIVSSLLSGKTSKEVNALLEGKYGTIDKSLVISATLLKKFADEFLNLYVKIQSDALAMRDGTAPSVVSEAKKMIEDNDHYKRRLAEMVDHEIDLKDTIKRLVIIVEDRVHAMFNRVIDHPENTKNDYLLVQYLNTLMASVDKLDKVVNGSPDKIQNQNVININILNEHTAVFQKIMRQIIERLDYDTSLLFIDMVEKEFGALKAPTDNTALPIELRVSETKLISEKLEKLDLPGF